MSRLKMKYFVLKPKGDDIYARASRKAMRVYASTIQQEDSQFAHELRAWADEEWQNTEEYKKALGTLDEGS